MKERQSLHKEPYKEQETSVQLALCDIKKKFFTVRRIDHWSNLPRDMVESSSLKVFKT